MLRWATIALATAAVMAGCSAEGPRAKPPRSVDAADRIMLTLPAAVNLDEKLGPDGLRARVFFFQAGRDEPLPVAGTAEFLLFDRKVGRAEALSSPPVQTWTFSGRELAPYLTKTIIGWGYNMELRWRENPTSAIITVFVRYTPDAGQPIYSSPMNVVVRPK